MAQKNGLYDTLAAIERETSGDKIAIKDIVAALERRGFGPLLIAPALITTLPTGAIPGIPAICALFILLIAVQIVFGARHPWLPRPVRDFSFSRKKFQNSVTRYSSYIRWVDDIFHPRFQFLTHKLAQWIIALLCVVLSVFIIILGFIPFAPLLPALAILMFGLGLSVRDGLLTFTGLVVVIAGLLFLPDLLPKLWPGGTP